MRRVSVQAEGHDGFTVTVTEAHSSSVHHVVVTPEDVARYAPGVSAERLLEASFDFLLEREPKEAILGRFDLPVIERYFPEYADQIATRV